MRLLVGFCLCLLLLGCAKSGPPVSQADTRPAGLSAASSQVPVDDAPTSKDLAKFQKEYALAKSAYAKKPSKTAKDTYVFTTVRLGLATMDSDDLDSKVKYPGAL